MEWEKDIITREKYAIRKKEYMEDKLLGTSVCFLIYEKINILLFVGSCNECSSEILSDWTHIIFFSEGIYFIYRN